VLFFLCLKVLGAGVGGGGKGGGDEGGESANCGGLDDVEMVGVIL
jgi:hypothetical protein